MTELNYIAAFFAVSAVACFLYSLFSISPPDEMTQGIGLDPAKDHRWNMFWAAAIQMALSVLTLLASGFVGLIKRI